MLVYNGLQIKYFKTNTTITYHSHIIKFIKTIHKRDIYYIILVIDASLVNNNL